ncbi:MAG TPA: DUF6084 family protein [Solirubrobacterales bacterium]
MTSTGTGNGWAVSAEDVPARPRDPRPGFVVRGARTSRLAAAPTLIFDLDVSDPSEQEIFTIALAVQIAIEPAQRRYDPETRERLVELLGDPRKIGAPTRTMPWAHVDVLVRPFRGSTSVAVPVPCSYDLEIAASNYFRSLRDGEVPLVFHFNGSVYYAGEDGRMQIVQISWEESSEYRMPISAWEEMIAAYYPNRGWVPAGAETVERLRRYKLEQGLPSYEAALERLLEAGEGER